MRVAGLSHGHNTTTLTSLELEPVYPEQQQLINHSASAPDYKLTKINFLILKLPCLPLQWSGYSWRDFLVEFSSVWFRKSCNGMPSG